MPNDERPQHPGQKPGPNTLTMCLRNPLRSIREYRAAGGRALRTITSLSLLAAMLFTGVLLAAVLTVTHTIPETSPAGANYLAQLRHPITLAMSAATWFVVILNYLTGIETQSLMEQRSRDTDS